MDIETFKVLSEGVGFSGETEDKEAFKKELEKIRPLEKELEAYLPKNAPQAKENLKFPSSPTKIRDEEKKLRNHANFTETQAQTHLTVEGDYIFQGFAFVSFLLDTAFVAMIFSALILSTALGLGSQAVHSLFTTSSILHFAFIFTIFFQIYAFFSRCYFGMTVGEAQQSLSLGTHKQKKSSLFLLLVIWRTLLNLATGLLLIPFISLLLKKDILGSLSGLFLYQQDPELKS